MGFASGMIAVTFMTEACIQGPCDARVEKKNRQDKDAEALHTYDAAVNIHATLELSSAPITAIGHFTGRGSNAFEL